MTDKFKWSTILYCPVCGKADLSDSHGIVSCNSCSFNYNYIQVTALKDALREIIPYIDGEITRLSKYPMTDYVDDIKLSFENYLLKKTGQDDVARCFDHEFNYDQLQEAYTAGATEFYYKGYEQGRTDEGQLTDAAFKDGYNRALNDVVNILHNKGIICRDHFNPCKGNCDEVYKYQVKCVWDEIQQLGKGV